MVILKYCETRKVKAGKSELGGSHFLVAHWQDDSSWHWSGWQSSLQKSE